MKTSKQKSFFKQTNNYYFLILVISLLCFQQCKCKKNAPIEIISPVTAIHGIAFFDVNSVPLQNVHNVKVTLIDPEKMVLSSNGFPFDSVRLTAGIMSIGLSPKAQYSAERPYRFTIRAEADGYMTNTRSIVIASGSPNYFPIFLAKLDNSGLPSSGLAATTGNINDVSGGVITTPQVLMTANKNVDSLMISIPANTRLFNGDKPVTENGPLSYRLLSGIAGDSNANRVFPGGFEITDAIDQTGEKIASATNPAFFTTAGWFSLEMNIGNTVVNRFSQPLNVVIPVGDSVINSATQQVAKAGDKIPIWSMNTSGTWRAEGEAQIVSSGGHLKASIQINHITAFNLDYKGPRCGTALGVTYIAADFATSYYSEYIRISDNAVLKQGSVNYGEIPGQTSQSIINAPDVGSGRLFVHDGASQINGGRGISDPLSCTGPVTAPLRKLIGTSNFCITIKFLRQDGTNLCANNVWLEPVGGTYKINAGVLNTGTVNIPQTTGNQTIQLYYAKTMSPPILLSISLNVDAPAGIEQAAQVSIDGILYSGATYIRDNSGTCGRTITVTIPDSIITASSIKCS